MQTTRIGYVRIPSDDERSVFEVEEADARIDGPYVADEDAAAIGEHSIYSEGSMPPLAGEYRHVTHGW